MEQILDWAKEDRHKRRHTVGFLSYEIQDKTRSIGTGGGETVIARRHAGTFWGNGNALYLDGGGGYIG